MSRIRTSVLWLFLGWVLLSSLGAYVTLVRQPEQLNRLEKAEEVARLKNTELVSLRTEASALTDQTNELVQRWHARYKVVPEELSSANVVGYFNDLTRTGFKNFDLNYRGLRHATDYKYHAFQVRGRAYYTSLYDFVWKIENSPNLYRIYDLRLSHIDLVTEDTETKAPRLDVMVTFEMEVDAYFAGIDGVSAPGTEDAAAGREETGLPSALAEELPPIPADVLPARRPATNPFYPVVLAQIPPNTYNRIDVEKATLVSVTGGMAVFQDEEGYRSVGLGDDVYLGHITSIDPRTGLVTARLNKGGIVDDVTLRLDVDASYRRAAGSVRLLPAN